MLFLLSSLKYCKMSINLQHYNNEAAFELDLKKMIAKRKMEGNLYNMVADLLITVQMCEGSRIFL